MSPYRSKEEVFLRRRLSRASFLASVRPLQTIRYFSFVACYAASLLLAVILQFSTAFLVLSGRASSEMTRVVITFGLSAACGAFGAWFRAIARDEERNIAAQEERELRLMGFEAEEDQRRIDNATIADLLKRLDALPGKTQEKIIADQLNRLARRRQGGSKGSSRSATA